MEPSKRFDRRTLIRLRRAGWHSGRDVLRELKLPSGFSLFPAALKVLAEFGGLDFRSRSGRTSLDPNAGEEILAEVKQYEERLGTCLYPLGICEGGDTIYILIDENGIIYALAGWLEPLASKFDMAIKYFAAVFLVSQNEQATDLSRVGLLGKRWTL